MNRKQLYSFIDPLLAPAVYLSGLIMHRARGFGFKNLPLSQRAMMKAGIYPIRNHFYEPLFDHTQLRYPLDQVRELPGIDWNVNEQLALLSEFAYGEELKTHLLAQDEEPVFSFNNRAFEPGDAEYLYSLIRLKKPGRVLEIGSGNSTKVVVKAIRKNQAEVPDYKCEHTCIEPYLAPWLEQAGVNVIRARVETLDKSIFGALQSGDLLFIDSSHMIRPQGDVLFEYLEILPTLQSGVIVHTHDIFSPRDYPKAWIVDDFRFWNEQYLLEAFLSCNSQWKIIGALNFLFHSHFERLQEKCPFLTKASIPGSFYIQKL